MKKVLSVAMCIAIMLSLVLEVGAATENDVLDSNTVSVEALPENIKNLIENYDEIESIDRNIDLGENLYDMSIPKEDDKTEVSVFAVPIKYKKNNGELAFIDTSFEKLGFTKRLLSKYDYKNTANEFDVLFSENAEDGFKMDEAFEMSVITEEKNNSDAEIDLDENKDGRLTYSDVYGDDTYIEYININSGVKENIVLEKNIGKNEFEFKWSSDTHILELSDDDTFIKVVSKDTGIVDYIFSPLYVYDSYTTIKNQENSIENNTVVETPTENTFATHSSTIEEVTIENTTTEDTATEVLTSDTNELVTTQNVFDTTENIEVVPESEIDSSETSNTTESYDVESITSETTTIESETEVSTESTTIISETQETVENVITTTESTVTVIPETQIITTEDINPNYVNKHNTEDCYYKITDNGNGNYIITAVISKDFLNSKETVYPVTIDPSVTASSSTSNIEDTYVYQAAPDSNYGSFSYMRLGYNGGKYWGYVKFKELPSEIGCGSQITIADLTLKFRPGQTTSSTGKIGGITSKNWSENSLTWNSRISWGGYNSTSDHNNCLYYKFNVIKLVQDWYNKKCPNYGFVFTYKDQTHNDYNSVYSSESSSANAPCLRIVYANVKKESYYGPNNTQYQRSAARYYALENWDYSSLTKDTPDCYSTLFSGGTLKNLYYGGDCTNFVSQCLHFGRMSPRGDESTRKEVTSWYYDYSKNYYYASYTWGGAEPFTKHWGHLPKDDPEHDDCLQRAYLTVIYEGPWDVLFDWDYIVSTFKEGDVIQYYKSSEGVTHSAIIHDVNLDNKTIEYAQHSSDAANIDLEEKMAEFLASEDKYDYSVILHKISR